MSVQRRGFTPHPISPCQCFFPRSVFDRAIQYWKSVQVLQPNQPISSSGGVVSNPATAFSGRVSVLQVKAQWNSVLRGPNSTVPFFLWRQRRGSGADQGPMGRDTISSNHRQMTLSPRLPPNQHGDRGSKDLRAPLYYPGTCPKRGWSGRIIRQDPSETAGASSAGQPVAVI